MITVEDVKRKVKRIEEKSGDYECAHSAEDSLYEAVLEAIAEGAPNASELAKEALKSKDIDFERWCA